MVLIKRMANEVFDEDVARAVMESGSLDCFGSNVEEIEDFLENLSVFTGVGK